MFWLSKITLVGQHTTNLINKKMYNLQQKVVLKRGTQKNDIMKINLAPSLTTQKHQHR